MTNNPIAPPRKKNKKTKSPSLSSIPDDVIVNVLARISKSHYRSLCLVSKNFNSLLSSPNIYFARSLIGNIEARLYVGLWLPNPSSYHSWFTLHFRQGQLSFKPVQFSLRPVRLSSSYSPDRLNSTTVAVHSEIYQIGGSNEDKRTRAVRVLDCRSHTWRRAPDMKVARKHARSYFLDEKIYVIGGCTETKEYLTSWGEVFDLKTQTWKPLPKPPSDDDVQLYKSVVCGGRLYAFTMNNNNKNYAYDPNEEKWVQEAGFVGLGRINGPWCVIGSAIFAERDRTFMWCDPRNGKWSVVYGLYHIYLERANNYITIQLVNHDGKLVIIWHQWNWRYKEYTSIWCAVISLEERLSPSSDLWGKVERCNVVLGSVHTSVKLSRCLSVSV
ncbi:putative F-box/kelch-repeat protein [Raphanus sativus]|uniref:F-box/kelch-repeat protein At4g35120 n=1 Tax=Raphanus sativus TaxID=3726 RepID=A0A6J0MNB8_RAPSA|nr:putative F-box/kelch-repeat protein At4g35120 [Raphanus sativus]KAJ4874152.1 putative F-box/kelch-repeat protein [Raphanus sativus]